MPLTYDTDYSDEIAALPKHTGYTTLPVRTAERYVTLHYSGVVYPKTDRAGQLRRILDEAKYQLHHDYGFGAYPDGLLYDLVVLDDGWRVLTRARRQQLWHCGNATGNKLSWAVHLMLGPNQDATTAQWAGCVNIIEQLCTLYNIPPTNVVGHNEWPRRDGVPQTSPTYRLLPEQSECPGKLLHARLASWRAASAPRPPLTLTYRLKVDQAVFTARDPAAPLAQGPDDGMTVRRKGESITVGDLTNGWAWDATGIGFLPLAVLEGPLP